MGNLTGTSKAKNIQEEHPLNTGTTQTWKGKIPSFTIIPSMMSPLHPSLIVERTPAMIITLATA